MAKIIKYKYLSHMLDNKYPVYAEKSITCASNEDVEINLNSILSEAFNGEYTIDDDGVDMPVSVEKQVKELATVVNMIREFTEKLGLSFKKEG